MYHLKCQIQVCKSGGTISESQAEIKTVNTDDEVCQESRMRENRTYGLMRGSGKEICLPRPTLLLKIHLFIYTKHHRATNVVHTCSANSLFLSNTTKVAKNLFVLIDNADL